MEAFQTTTNDALIVERSVPVTVMPEQETPGGSLFLSVFDQSAVCFMSTVYSFDRSDANMVDVIKKALSKVLVHYYPLAGRLAKNSQGMWTVDCKKKLGVPFVEALATCDLQNLGDMQLLDSYVLPKLVYRDPTEDMLEVAPLLTAQVTKFRCGGFTLGVTINHCMADGSSLMNFIISWAEIARGRPLSLIPCHDRTILKSKIPPQTNVTWNNVVPTSDESHVMALYEEEQIVWKSFHFDSKKLATLKKMATADGQVMSSCSSFVALAAQVWRARSMALQMKPEQLSELFFAVDFRSTLKPPMLGYFGNAVAGARCRCTVEELIDEPISSTAGRIKKAIEKVDEDYVRTWIDSLAACQIDSLLWSSLVLTSWQRLDYGSADFGWGKPKSLGTGELPRATCVFMPEGGERKGIAALLGLPLSAMNTFEKLIQLE